MPAETSAKNFMRHKAPVLGRRQRIDPESQIDEDERSDLETESSDSAKARSPASSIDDEDIITSTLERYTTFKKDGIVPTTAPTHTQERGDGVLDPSSDGIDSEASLELQRVTAEVRIREIKGKAAR